MSLGEESTLLFMREFAWSLYQSGQGHSRDRADQFDCLTIVDVTVSHSELLSF